MKTKINVNYLGHHIKVINKFNEMSLVIDDVVCDAYKAVIAFPFTLKGIIEDEGRQIEILLTLKLKFPVSALFLTADGKLLAKKRIL